VKRAAVTAVGALALVAVGGGWFAPYVDGELASWLQPHVIVDPAPAQLAKGRMVDDYFAVEDLGDGTFAIGEPRCVCPGPYAEFGGAIRCDEPAVIHRRFHLSDDAVRFLAGRQSLGLSNDGGNATQDAASGYRAMDGALLPQERAGIGAVAVDERLARFGCDLNGC